MCAQQVMDEFVKPASKDAGQGLEGTVDELSERVRAASNRFFFIFLGRVSTLAQIRADLAHMQCVLRLVTTLDITLYSRGCGEASIILCCLSRPHCENALERG